MDKNFHKSLPEVHQLDDYYDCMKGQNAYCKAIVKLHPTTGIENSSLWTAIQETKQDNRYYSRDTIYHGFCVPKINISSESSVHEYYNSKFANNYSFSEFEFLLCPSNEEEASEVYNQMLRFFFLGYLVLIFFATIYDYFSSKHNSEGNDQLRNGNVTMFWHSDYKNKILEEAVVRVKPSVRAISLLSNWKKIFSSNNNFNKTGSLQFLRVITMAYIVQSHSNLLLFTNFTRNIEEVENIFKQPFALYVSNIGGFAVQIFFFISAFLLSIQISEIYDSNSRFTIKDLLKTALNRYFRLVFLVFLGTLLITSSYFHGLQIDNGIHTAAVDLEYRICRRDWWRNLLLIHNNDDNPCFLGSWYVAAEMQLCLISLFILYLVFKKKNQAYKIFGFSTGAALVIQASFLYFSKVDVANYSYFPDNINLEKMKRSRDYRLLYSTTAANITSYLIGLIAGYFYNQHKDLNLEKKKIIHTMWLSLSSLVFILSLVLSVQIYSPGKITTSFVGAALKPIFTIAFAIFILGLLFNVNSGVRIFFEHPVFQILAKFSYSIYISHFFHLLLRLNLTKEFQTFSTYYMLKWIVVDQITSLIIGFIVHIVFELPALNLQKIFVPQVRKIKKNASKTE